MEKNKTIDPLNFILKYFIKFQKFQKANCNTYKTFLKVKAKKIKSSLTDMSLTETRLP